MRSGEYKTLATKIIKLFLRCGSSVLFYGSLILRGRFREFFSRVNYALFGRRKMKNIILNDKRFHIKDEVLNGILRSPLEKYELIKVRLGDIRRGWNGKIMTLPETSVYKYLETGDREMYQRYCDLHNNVITVDGYDELITSFDREGYDIKKGVIVLSGDSDYNAVWDGQHRSCMMLKKYGADYLVDAVRVYHCNYK